MSKKKTIIWGIGIEAEFATFHNPTIHMKKEILFPFFDPRREMPDCVARSPHVKLFSYLFYYPYTRKHKGLQVEKYPEKFINAVELAREAEIEPATKSCDGRIIFGTDPKFVYYLTELKTKEPFSYPGRGIRYMEKYVFSLQKVIAQYLNDVTVYRPLYMKQEDKKIGVPDVFPYGMSSRILLRDLNTGTFEKEPHVINYTGSYHFTFTPPFKPNSKTSCVAHKEAIIAFGNLVQWIEPLLCAAYMTGDDRAVGQGVKYTRGSFRMVMSGWGNFGGADLTGLVCPKPKKIELSEQAILTLNEEMMMGRRSVRDPDWRHKLHFKDIDRLKACRRFDPDTGNYPNMGSDLRVRLFIEPFQDDKKYYTVTSGIELRMLDWFHPKHLQSTGRLFTELAELSRIRKKQSFVYHDKDWNKAVIAVVTLGWRAPLPEGYIQKLNTVMGFDLKPKTLRAYDVFKAFTKELFEKTKNGEWTNLMLQKKYKKPITLPKINQKGWEFAFLQFLIDNPIYQQKLKRFLYQLGKKCNRSTNQTKSLQLSTIYSIFHKEFSPNQNWKVNIEDIIAFLERFHVLKSEIKYDGSFHKVTDFDINKSRRFQENLTTTVLKDLLAG